MKHYRAGVLGATGAVGQRFVQLLADHPWFELTGLMASEKSAGRTYRDSCRWILKESMPSKAAGMKVEPCVPDEELDVVFSGLDAAIAGPIETAFARSGAAVVSNTRTHRMAPDVPLIIPEVNPEHLELIGFQKKHTDGTGFIVTNPNCSTIVMCLALAPLHRKFTVKKVMVSTLQAISGAGYPGLSAIDMLDNVIPFIDKEESKMETEPLKIFGHVQEGTVIPADFRISARCHRVMVSDGHLMSISVEFVRKPSLEAILTCWKDFNPIDTAGRLPMSPDELIHICSEPDRPQPSKDRDLGGGMTISIGRLTQCNVLDYKFTAFGHNTIRGAAGGSILVAELLASRHLLNPGKTFE